MSSRYYYLPIPPRVWSRVQSPCTFTNPNDDYTQAFIPLTNQTVSLAQANYEEKLLYKGNILQHKNNSARLTKSQKYTQLAKCMGPSRTKVFATQSQTYTNPNTTGLLRVNYNTFPFPNELVGQPNYISGPFQYNVPSPFDCSSNALQDGGNLVCGTYANQCTGEIIKSGKTSAVICNPSYCSDVPGSPTLLCWNTKLQTWFPKPRYVMNNSTDGWPEGYKGFVSASTPVPPVLTLVSTTPTTANILWKDINNKCIPISSYRIYLNGQLYTTVSYQITSYTLTNLSCNNTIYVVSVSTNIESEKSNIVISNNAPLPPVLTLVSTTCSSATFSWTNNSLCTTSYNIYQNAVLIANVITTSYTAINLSLNTPYSFYVTALASTIESPPSNTLLVTIPSCGFNFTGSPSTNYVTSTLVIGSVTYNVITFRLGTFTFISNCCTDIYQLFVVAGGANGVFRDGGNGGQVLSYGNNSVGGDKILVNTSNIFTLTVGAGGAPAANSTSQVTGITGNVLNFTAIGGGGALGGTDDGGSPPILTPAGNGTINIYNNKYYGGGGGSSGGSKQPGLIGGFGGGGGGGGSYNGQGAGGIAFNGGQGGGVNGSGTDGGAGGIGAIVNPSQGTAGTASQFGGGGGGGSWGSGKAGANGGNGGTGGGASGLGGGPQPSSPGGGSGGGGGGGGYYGGGGGAGGQGGGSGVAGGQGGGGGAGTIILIYR